MSLMSLRKFVAWSILIGLPTLGMTILSVLFAGWKDGLIMVGVCLGAILMGLIIIGLLNWAHNVVRDR